MAVGYSGPMDATQTFGQSAVPADARPDIVARGFRANKDVLTERHWVRGDPCFTAFFNALSAVFPHGETFMVRSLMPWVDRVPEELNGQVKAFIEQEAGHAREHGAMNKALIGAGYDIEPLERRIRGFVAFFADASDIVKLTATMCIEHFTAIIAAELLKNRYHLDGVEDEMRELWLWHAVEEVEHKGVAFDVWDYATKDWNSVRRYLWRSFFMAAVTTSFFVNRTLGQIELLRQDGYAFGWSLKNILRAGFGTGGIGRNVLRPWASFFRFGFHPWDKDDRLLLAGGEADIAHIAAKRAGFGVPLTQAEVAPVSAPEVAAA